MKLLQKIRYIYSSPRPQDAGIDNEVIAIKQNSTGSRQASSQAMKYCPSLTANPAGAAQGESAESDGESERDPRRRLPRLARRTARPEYLLDGGEILRAHAHGPTVGVELLLRRIAWPSRIARPSPTLLQPCPPRALSSVCHPSRSLYC
jgi:hypothetical protein